MNYKYSDRITRILGYSKEEALRLNNDYIGPEHLMLGLIREGNSRALDVLRRKFYVNIPSVKEVLERAVKDHGTTLLSTDIALNKKSTTIMRLTILEARLLKSEESDAEHMLLAILKQNDNTVARVLNDCDVSYKELYDSLSTLILMRRMMEKMLHHHLQMRRLQHQTVRQHLRQPRKETLTLLPLTSSDSTSPVLPARGSWIPW